MRAFVDVADKQIVELFGAEFAGMLMQIDQTGRWEGPVRSSYGWHLVQALAIQPEWAPPFEDIRPTLLADFRQKRLAQLEDEAWQSIRARYSVDAEVLAQ